MEVYTSAQLTIPMIQVVLLLALSTGALLLGRFRLALLINYCFTLYWGYVANMGLFTAKEVSKLNGYSFIYFSFGIVVVLLAMIGLITHRE